MIQKTVFIFFICFFCFHTFGQKRKPKHSVKDSISSEAFLKMVEKSLIAFYEEYENDSNYDSIIDALEYEANEIPEFSDSVICERLEKMNELSPFHLDCNPTTLSVIRFFAKNRRSFIRIALGRSKLYFDMYEEALAKYDIPIDLRFLSVIESGLRPQVKSPAGALGLWQFMYGTGKMYGLKENSYFDERMDPAKSTDAACRYLKKLYDIYGDWNLALAAYNTGPGNLNKAIRRSGGKRTYWEVRPFLHPETQGYVPNFIAAAYLMTYHAEHNLVPMEPKIHYTQVDTICLKKGVHMETISQLINWEIEDVQKLNPIYKTTYIPLTEPRQCIRGHLMKIGQLVSLEDSLYQLEKQLYEIPVLPAIDPKMAIDSNQTTEANNTNDFIFHKVRRGETLTKISQKYKVTNSQMMEWNNLRSTKVPVGKVLKVRKKVTTEVNTNPPVTNETVNNSKKNDFVFHKVRKGETLTKISQKYKVTNSQVMEWNNLRSTKVPVGKVLKIRKTPAVEVADTNARVNPANETTETVSNSQESDFIFHKVKKGETLTKISQKYKVTNAQMMEWNNLRSTKVPVGKVLKIRKIPTVEIADTTTHVNPANETETVSNSNRSDFIFHKVKKGETLTKISQKYKVTNAQMMQWNNLSSAKVPVGKVLKIRKNQIEAPNTVSKSDSIMGLIYYDSLIKVYHTVKRNENIEAISAKYKVRVEDIKKWNNLKDNWLNIDQRLLIITTIKFSKPGMVLKPKEETPTIDQKPVVPKKKYYTIKSGDLFNRVAQKYGMTTQQLMKLNPGVDPDKIKVGQQIRVN